MTVCHTSLNCTRTDVITRTAKVLNMYGNGELLRTGCETGVSCDHRKVCGLVIPFNDVKACDFSHNAALNHVIAQIRSLDELGRLKDIRVCAGSDKNISPAVIGNVRLGHSLSDVNDSVINAVSRKSSYIHNRCACDKNGRTVIVLNGSKGIARTVKPVSYKVVGNELCIVAVNDLIYRLVLVNGEVLVSGGACARLDTVCLVVIGNSHFGVSYGNFDNARLGAALIIGVEHNAVLQLVFLADLCKNKT